MLNHTHAHTRTYTRALSCRTQTGRAEGGLGDVDIKLLSDLTHKISKNYGVLLEDIGHTLR